MIKLKFKTGNKIDCEAFAEVMKKEGFQLKRPVYFSILRWGWCAEMFRVSTIKSA